jgi:signal transduction histidine kinase
MTLNWNIEVFMALLGFIFFCIFCLLLAWFTYKNKTRLYIYTLLTFSILAAYQFFETTGYLFLNFELKRLSLITISVGLFCLILNVDIISKEKIGYYKIIVASFIIGITIVLTFIPGNIELYPHKVWGYPTMGMKGLLQLIIISTILIFCLQLTVWLFKTWHNAPPELKKDAFNLFLTSLILYICFAFVFLLGLWLLFPIIDLITSTSIIITSFFIYREPKLLYILSFEGQRITVITNQSGIPLFDLSWHLNGNGLIDEQKDFIKWIPVLQQLSNKISSSGVIEEIKLESSTILSKQADYVTVILLSSRSSPILREALDNFINAFENRYQKLLKTGMTQTIYFQDSIELINEIFPLGTVSAIKNIETLESYLDELVKQRTYELEQMTARLQETDHLKSLFLASISHEFRTPLNSILGFTEILMQSYSGDFDEEQFDYLNSVHGSAEHLLNLINGILDISRIEAGQFEVYPGDFYVNESIKQVVEALSIEITKKNIILKMDMDSNNRINTDEARFKQILFNLIGNAVKFTPINGEIIVKTRKNGQNQVDIHIIDNGIGISREDMNKLFKPFQQIDMSITKHYPGSGLGLYLTKKLINVLGGRISVQSEKGKGSDFNFILPIKIKTSNIS